MKRVLEFLNKYVLVFEWTIVYIVIMWCILEFLFKFNMLSVSDWHKLSHASLHGFGGFIFNLLMCTSIPIYIATSLTVFRTQKPIIPIPFVRKIFGFIKNIFAKKELESESEKPEETSEETQPTIQTTEFPSGLPSELYVPYTRAKNHQSFIGETSIFNKVKTDSEKTPEPLENPQETAMPIPSDFDISDTIENMDESIPVFQDINFEETLTPTKDIAENSVTKYFDEHKIEYEKYHEFIATEKYLIYTHDDSDFWIMDEENWFAAGKQIDSPIPEMIQIAKDNNLTPVIYLESQNIMDIDETIQQIESTGIKVIKDLSEL